MAYLKNHGYVGIGRVIEKAVGVKDFKIDGKPLKEFELQNPNIFDNCDNEKSEFLVKIDWIKAVEREQAKWKKRFGLFTTQQIKASLKGQHKTIQFVETEFGIKFKDLLLTE